MDGVHYDAKQWQHSIICIQPDPDTDGYDSDVYCAEWDHSAHQNRDIQPDEDITDQMTASDTTPVSESDTTCRTEIYKFHTKLAQMAEHLADITTATLRQSKFTEEDVEFSCLIWDCGEELAGMGEFLIEVANTISENVSVEMPEIQVIEISDSDDDTPVTNEILSTVQDSAKRKIPSAKSHRGHHNQFRTLQRDQWKNIMMVQEAHCNQFRILQPIQCNYHQFRFLQKTNNMYQIPCQQTPR